MAARGRRSGMVFIVLALVLVILLAAGAYIFKDVLFPAQAPVAPVNPTPVAPAVKTLDIVVLTQNVSFGQVIPQEALGVAPIPEASFVDGLYFKTKDQVKGRRARYQLQAGTILTAGMLSEGATGSYASSMIPPGYVAVSIPISRLTSVSYALQPGDHVSVMVALLLEELDPNFQSKLPNTTAAVVAPGSTTTTTTEKTASTGPTSLTLSITSGGTGSVQGRTELDPILNKPVYVQPAEAQRPRIVSQVLVTDAMILGVGRFPKGGGPTDAQPTVVPTAVPNAPTPTPAPAAADSGDPDMITLIVTPQDAVTLNYIMLNRGAVLNLALRSAGDTKSLKTEAVTLQFLMDQYSIPFPSKLPYGLEPRVDELNYYGYIQQPTPVPAPAQ
jgi:Flp pilus assembly protein CpaB